MIYEYARWVTYLILDKYSICSFDFGLHEAGARSVSESVANRIRVSWLCRRIRLSELKIELAFQRDQALSRSYYVGLVQFFS